MKKYNYDEKTTSIVEKELSGCDFDRWIELYDQVQKEFHMNQEMSPIVVEPALRSGFYRIVDGRNRLKAIINLNVEEIKCIITGTEGIHTIKISRILL